MIKTYYILGDEKVNNYNDYYSYINYMTGNTDMPNMGMRNIDMNYQPIVNGIENPNYVDYMESKNIDMNYQNINNNIPNNNIPNNIDNRNIGVNYQTTDNNIFANNFMMPSTSGELLEPKDGLEKGNLFKNEYIPFKNYKPMKLEPKTERQKKLNEILSYGFAMKDLNLYLDMNPSNTTYINLYNEYRKIKNNLTNQYEKMYGPLNLNSSALEQNNWVWNNSPWPWEGDR